MQDTHSHFSKHQNNITTLNPHTVKQFTQLSAITTTTETATDDSALYACDRESWTLASPFCNPDF